MSVSVQLPPLLHYAPVAIACVDLEGRVLDANRALVEASGFTVDEIRGRSFSAFIDPGAEDEARSMFSALARGEEDFYRIGRKYRTRSGELRDVDLSVSLVRDAVGAPAMCLAVLQDVTPHRRAVENEARRAAELEAIIDSIPAAVYIGGASGITRANRVAVEQLGFARRRICSGTWRSCPSSSEPVRRDRRTRDAGRGAVRPRDSR